MFRTPLCLKIYLKKWLKKIAFLALAIGVIIVAPASLALSPEYEADRLLLAMEQAVEQQDYQQADHYWQQARKLDVELPAVTHYFAGLTRHALGDTINARKALNQYVESSGREGEYYLEALQLITELQQRNSDDQKNNSKNADIQWQIPTADNNHDYLATLQNRYATQSPLDALIMHTNSLLAFYAYHHPGLLASSHLQAPAHYRITANPERGLLKVSNLLPNANGTLQPVEEIRVYGISPYLKYRCQTRHSRCIFLHPATQKSWLSVSDEPEGVQQLGEVISHLIKFLQKQGQ